MNYYFVASIVKYVNNILNYRLNNIRTLYELNQIKMELNNIVTYHRLRIVVISNKSQYENGEIDQLSNEILEKMSKISDFDRKIYDIEKEYYNKLIPIIKKIEEKIKRKLNPVIELLKKIEKYENVQLDYLVISSHYLLEFNGIKSIRKADEVIGKCYYEVRTSFIKFLRNEKQMYADDFNYCEYINQVLLKIDGSKNLEELNLVMAEYDNNFEKSMNNRKEKIINEAQFYLNENNVDADFLTYGLKMYVNDIRKSVNKKNFDYLYLNIKQEILNILKEKFKRKVDKDNVNYRLKFKYIDKLYNIKTENELNELIAEYEAAFDTQKEKNTAFNDIKNAFKKDLEDMKKKYEGCSFENKINTYILRLEHCNTIQSFRSIMEFFQEEHFFYERSVFQNEIMNDMANSYFYSLACEYYLELFNINNMEQLKKMREQYIKERQELLTKDNEYNFASRM